MKRKLATKETPVLILNGVFPEYTKEGIAVDCGHIILVRKGTATLKINFREVFQSDNVVAILFPGDVVMVENVSSDFELEYLVYTEEILNYIFIELKSLSIAVFKEYSHNSSLEIARLVDSLFAIVEASTKFGTISDTRKIAIYQLCGFFTAYHAFLVNRGLATGHYTSRSKELFAKFMQLLHENYRESRNVLYYADAMNVTTRYLSKIIVECTGSSAKNVIDEYVLMQIKSVLQNSDILISEISWAFNFSNFSFFTDYFKRHTGLTPNAYRKKYAI